MRVAPPVIAFGGKVELLFVLQGGQMPLTPHPPGRVEPVRSGRIGSAINMTEVFPRGNAIANQPLQFLDLGKAALIFS